MGDNAETPDPVTGLTSTEVEAVRDNWGELCKSWKTYGPELFCILFEDPKIRKFFPAFDGLEMDEVRRSTKLRAHAINFKHGITSFIDHLDDLECLVVLIHKQASNHFKRGIRIEEFKKAFKLFHSFAQSKTGMNEITANAWQKTLDVLADVMGNHMNELDGETKNTNS